MIRGVNLGGWLVLEKWITPHLFAGLAATDEAHLWRELDARGECARVRAHRESFITESDFVDLARRGIEAVRIPVPYFAFGGHPPFMTCVDELDHAFTWAERHGVSLLLDLHTVPDSQNAHDGGGLCGVCKWHRSAAYVDLALDVLEQLARRYRDHPSLWGLEVLNEPISRRQWDLVDVRRRYPAADPGESLGSEPVPTAFLKGFYERAYERIRSHAPELRVVFHDGFRAAELAPFFAAARFEHIAIDTHLYLMHHTMAVGDGDLEDYEAVIAGEFSTTLGTLARVAPVIVGEWSLEPASERAPAANPSRRAYYRALASAQLEAWRPALGWFFWTYKLAGPVSATSQLWDLRQAIDAGHLRL